MIELMLVLVILATLAAVVLPKLTGRSKQAKVTAAGTQIAQIEVALDAFEIDLGRYPTTSDYHMPRALQIARDQGLNPSAAASPIKAEYWLKNHARETLAWGKYLAQKYLPFLGGLLDRLSI